MLTRAEINLISESVAEKLEIMKDELMSSKKCAEWLGISLNTLHKRCEKGKIPCHRKHNALYFSKREVTLYYLKDDKPAS